MMKNIDINFSILIPAFNEEKIIINTIIEVDNFFKNQSYEIIIIDD
jgi:glycosyltransferase involved in cell wall biosynthesis